MTSAAYVAKRLARLAAEIRVELKRPTVAARHAVAADLVLAVEHLDAAASLLAAEYTAPAGAVAANIDGVAGEIVVESDAVRFAFIATGRRGFAGPEIYAQNAEGTVWADAQNAGIEHAYRFNRREDADRIASTRGGYAYPIPA